MKNTTNQEQFRIIQGGPIEVSGNFTITGSDGNIIKVKSPAYLCRCGSSNNKPFCDGTHSKIEFKA
jgi:CDGSH iron-sulfur domain-containing protein 3